MPTVATISNAPATAGLAKAAVSNAGQATITAALSGFTSTATITVIRTVQSIALVPNAVAPQTVTLAKGTSVSFRATATYTDGAKQDITASVVFSSSSPLVAAFRGAPGVVTGIAVGMATITAQDPLSHLSATAVVTVTAATLTGITVTPANATLARGQTRQYTATGTYTDSTQVDLTQAVLWATVNPNVATVDINGVAAGVAVGQTTITATESGSGLVGSTRITVNDPTLVPKSHILYNLAGGQTSLWDVDTAARFTEHLYGPYAGYRATALATGPDGMTHILWNSVGGVVSLWAVAPNGAFTFQTYGPFTDAPQNVWKATALSIGPDNAPHILWNNPDGNVAYWSINPQTGKVTASAYALAGATATALATGGDGISHILWNNVNGTVSLWAVDTAGGVTKMNYGPFPGYKATAISVGTDGTIHLLWNNVNGTVAFWDIGISGAVTAAAYGPYANGWAAVACSTGPDNLSHILWGRPDQTVSFWDVNSTDFSFNYHVYAPPTTSGYTPVAVSSGP